MARYVMILRGATSLRGALEGVGPEIETFLGPGMALASPVPFTYCAIKTTGTLIVITKQNRTSWIKNFFNRDVHSYKRTM